MSAEQDVPLEAPDAYGDPSKLVLANGTYDLEREEFTECSPGPTDVIRLPITYDPSAESYVFDRALEDWFGEEGTEYMDAVWEMFAASMLKKHVVRKMYVHHGSGANGKSTCLAVLRQMLGPENTASVGFQEFDDSRFAADVVRGRLANISDGDHIRNPAQTCLIEALLGGETITCERRYRKPIEYRPFCTLIFTFNELPAALCNGIPDRRIQLVPWTNKFERGDPEIVGLPYNEDERSGLFNRLVPVMRRLLSADAE